MEVNRRVKLLSPGQLVTVEETPPVPGPGEYLIKVSAVGVCGSDVHYFEHGRIGNFVVKAPLVLGHESSGVIVGSGLGADESRIGRRVAIEPGVPCGHCGQCRSGQYNLCRGVKFLATPPVDGAFSDYIVHSQYFVHDVPEGLSDDEAALCEPLSVGIWANVKASVEPGDHVLVTGCGPIGLLAAQVARERGGTVTVSDIVPERLEVAKTLGFEELHDPKTAPLEESGIKADVLLECTGVAGVVRGGIAVLAPAGRAVLVGMAPEAEQVLPVASIQSEEVLLTGTFRYANTYPTAIDLLVRKRVDVGPLIEGHYGLSQVPEALTASRRDPSRIKPMVVPALAE